MTVFRPCFGCTARADCDIKKGVVKALRGIPVTSAKIKCDLPFTRDFPPGTRVAVLVWDHRDFVPTLHQDRPTPIRMGATVCGPSSAKPGKLLLHLDQKISFANEAESEFRAAYPKEVDRLDEPVRDLCKNCRLVPDRCSCWRDE